MIFRLRERGLSPLTEGRVCAEWQNTLPPQFILQGARAALKGPAPTKTPFFAGEIQRDAVGRTCNRDVSESPVGRFFCRCVCFMLNLVTFSALEGSQAFCEPKLIVLETYQLYSRLISCTRDSVVLKRLEPSIWSLSVCAPVCCHNIVVSGLGCLC